jgi:hypothetical protein
LNLHRWGVVVDIIKDALPDQIIDEVLATL